MLSLIPLGVSSALPTQDRHFSSAALVREGHIFLFDCGEGTQLQLARAGLRRPRIEAIFITHLHGDHVYGLPGLLSTLALLEYDRKLHIVGPAGLREGLAAFMHPPGERGLPFPIEYTVLSPGFAQEVVLETSEYRVEARPLDHSIFAIGYRFEDKPRPGTLHPDRARELGVLNVTDFGRLKAGQSVPVPGGMVHPHDVLGPPHPGGAFAYVTDTGPCRGGVELAREADLVYHEATFREAEIGKARATGHATAREAAEVARQAGASRLLLGHFSARYNPDAIDGLLSEARVLFQNTEAAEELKRYDITPRIAPGTAEVPGLSRA